MATKPRALLASALLFAALAATAYAAMIRTPNDVNTACDFTTVPQLCKDLVPKYAATTLRELTHSAIKEAMEEADRGKVKAEGLLTASGEKEGKTVESGLGTCTQDLEQAADALHKASGNMEADDGYAGVVKEAQAAVTYVDACNDAFSAHPGVANPLADNLSLLKKLVGNSLSLAMALQVQAKGEAPAGH